MQTVPELQTIASFRPLLAAPVRVIANWAVRDAGCL